jgi:hypothetical protein
MTTKLFSAIIAFTATFFFASGLVWLINGSLRPQNSHVGHRAHACFTHPHSDTAHRIESFLRRDIENGIERNSRLDSIDRGLRLPFTKISLSKTTEAVNAYVSMSSSMDQGDLPWEFQQAWDKHMSAWRSEAVFLKKLSNSKMSEIDADEVKENLTQSSREIKETWEDLLFIAEQNGAHRPGTHR